MNPAILACDLHDHVEIICMRRYPVLIHQLDGSTVQGIARDTRSTAQEEFLLLDKDGQKVEIPLSCRLNVLRYWMPMHPNSGFGYSKAAAALFKPIPAIAGEVTTT